MNDRKAKIKISHKPYPIDIEMRPLWRISLIVLIVNFFYEKNKKLDLQRLNILLWMVIRTGKWQLYSRYLHEKDQSAPFMSSDQASFVAIEIALENKIVAYEGNKIIPLSTANELYTLIVENGLMKSEREFIAENAAKLSQTKIDGIMGKK